MTTAHRRLLIIGGAEDKLGRSRVLARFVELAATPGGTRVVVLPTASSVPDEMITVYDDVFRRLGADEVRGVAPHDRLDAADPGLVAAVERSTGVFMTGGNQLKLAQVIAGTPLGAAIHAAHERGAVVAGTSAGASIMSSHMISMGDEGITPRQRSSQLSAGLGLLPGVIVDQHFDQRGRYGRLLSLVAQSPSLLGMGIDEDTAALVTDGRELEVLGSGAVFVVDASHARSDAHEARQGAPLLVSGAVVHTLPSGAVFDLATRTLSSFVQQHADEQVVAAHLDRDEATSIARRLHAERATTSAARAGWPADDR
jgi:cyanophycinase